MKSIKHSISISIKIKEHREKSGLTQAEFGKLLGVSAQAVYKWEQDLCYPDITILPLLANILGCSIDEFFQNEYNKF